MQNPRSQFWTASEPEIMEMPDRLDSGTAADMEQGASYCIQNGTRELVLDCASMNYLTSAGLRAILSLARDLQRVEGKLAVCNLQGQAEAMFKACGFDRLVPVCSNRDEAVARLTA